MIKGLKELYPEANIAAMDYDAGSSSVNQVNRLKLMMSVAWKQLEEVGGEALSAPAAFPLASVLSERKDAPGFLG
ncbi:hypothetical protein D3C73_1446290 [compost metagenome]